MPPRHARKPARRPARRRNPIHSRVRDLPASLRSALNEVGYGSADIELRGADTFTYQRIADDGERAFTLLVNMATGESRVEWGTYGSGSTTNRVDADRSRHPIPPNGAVIQGVTGRGHPVYATITVHPSNLATMLPAPAELSPQAQLALEIIGGYNSRGRIDEFAYRKLGAYGPTNPLVQELAAKGLVKITASGVQITTEGKSARRRNPSKRRNPLPAVVVTAALTLLPYVVSALGRKVAAFNALPRAQRKAKLIAMLNSRWLYLSPAILPVARLVAKSDVALDTLIDGIAGHGQTAVKAGGAAARAALAAKGAPAASAPRANPKTPPDAHPAYKGSEYMDYTWWVEHYAPPEVRAEAHARHVAEQARLYAPPPITAAQARQVEREEAAMGRALRAEARREGAACRKGRRNPTYRFPVGTRVIVTTDIIDIRKGGRRFLAARAGDRGVIIDNRGSSDWPRVRLDDGRRITVDAEAGELRRE